jgi:hypothetical protein
MRTIAIYSILGLNPPYTVYACDIYGNQCILMAVINAAPSPYISVFLPPQFNNAPSVGIKLITSDDCEVFKIYSCVVTFETKQFQDFVDFEFMDNILYDFQN